MISVLRSVEQRTGQKTKNRHFDFNSFQFFFYFLSTVPFYHSSDSEDLEKMSKMDDGSATTAPLQAVPPAMPPVPPPPVMGGDMSGYGNYGSWYQVCAIQL